MFCVLFCVAKPYTIQITAPHNSGDQLSSFFYEEYFSETLRFDQSVYLDGKGEAKIQVESTENELLVLRIGTVNTQLYLGSSSTYFVIFDTEKALKPLKFDNDNWAPVSFFQIDPNDINVQLEELNKAHSEFFKEHYSDILQVLSQPNSHVKEDLKSKENVKLSLSNDNDSLVRKTQALQIFLENKYAERIGKVTRSMKKNDFLNQTALYLKMELSSLLGRNQDDLFESYLKDKKYPRNLEYVNSAKTFYAGILEELYTSEFRNSFNKYIYNLDLDSALLVADSALTNHNKELEFELLAGIEKALDLPNISNRDVTMLLEVLIRKGTAENSKMAKNLRNQYQVGRTGYELPECIFLDLDEELHSNSDWKGKIVYLNFFTTWNLESVGYMEQVKKLQGRYGIQVEFISVCMDENWEDYKNFLIDHPKYTWNIYFGNTDKLLKEKLGVASIPHHLLVGADLKVVTDFTPDPYSIEPYLKRLLK